MTEFVSGNQAEIFLNGNECLSKLLERLDLARHHIHIETMAFNNDKTIRQVADLLMNKSQLESVEVRLLTNFPATDWSIPMLKGTPNNPGDTKLNKPSLSLPLFDQMRIAGVQVINSHPISHFGTDAEIIESKDIDNLIRVYPNIVGPILFKIKEMILSRYYRREDFDPAEVPIEFQLKQEELDLKHKVTLPGHLDHRKLIVIDGKEAFICTFNMAREYLYEIPFNENLHENFWLDAMVWLRGPVVNQVQKLFAERWILSAGDVFTKNFQPSPDDPYTPVLPEEGNMRVKVVGSGYESKEENPIRNEMELVLKDRRGQLINIVNPYVCDGGHGGKAGLMDKLIEASKAGSKILLITSDHHLDSPPSRDASQYRYEKMLKSGINICEYPGRMLHAKLMTVGEDWATIGSYNFNYRSARRDLECNAFIISKDFVDQIDAKVIQPLRKAAESAAISNEEPEENHIIGCLDLLAFQGLPNEVKTV